MYSRHQRYTAIDADTLQCEAAIDDPTVFNDEFTRHGETMTRVRYLIVATTLVAVVAVTAAQDRVPVVPGIDVTGMDLSVRPQDDFFRYVNGRWADDTPIPADQSAYGTFGILRERA